MKTFRFRDVLHAMRLIVWPMLGIYFGVATLLYFQTSQKIEVAVSDVILSRNEYRGYTLDVQKSEYNAEEKILILSKERKWSMILLTPLALCVAIAGFVILDPKEEIQYRK